MTNKEKPDWFDSCGMCNRPASFNQEYQEEWYRVHSETIWRVPGKDWMYVTNSGDELICSRCFEERWGEE